VSTKIGYSVNMMVL